MFDLTPLFVVGGGAAGAADPPIGWELAERYPEVYRDPPVFLQHRPRCPVCGHPTGDCFAGDTEFITRDGLTTFADATGTTVLVLTPDARSTGDRPVNSSGRWVEAEVRNYGERRVMAVTIRRGGQRRTIRATPTHQWFASMAHTGRARTKVEAIQTKDLRPGMALASLLPQRLVGRSTPSPVGIMAGFVFGDGTRHPGWGCSVELWGDKDATLLPLFAGHPWSVVKTERGVMGTRIRGLPGSWKELPRMDEGTSFLFGWLAGYLAADGTVDSAGSVTLCSAQRAHLEHAAVVALQLGVSTYGISTTMRRGYGAEPSAMYRMSFVGQTVPPEILVIPEHRRRFESVTHGKAPVRWTVEGVTDNGESDEVYCVSVPSTESFSLADNVWVHNCTEEDHYAMVNAQARATDDPGFVRAALQAGHLTADEANKRAADQNGPGPRLVVIKEDVWVEKSDPGATTTRTILLYGRGHVVTEDAAIEAKAAYQQQQNLTPGETK